jgi:hypothetical protein
MFNLSRPAIRAGVLVEAILLHTLTTMATAADETIQLTPTRVELLRSMQAPVRLFTIGTPVTQSRHPFRLELEGARAQAEDWLHDAGFSLLEERDGNGRHGYAVISGALVSAGPIIRLRARFGERHLPASMSVRSEMPAIGITMPWRQYSLEFESMQDATLGYVLMQSIQWSAPQQRIQWGFALPIAVRHGPSAGILLQLRVRLGG